MSTGIFSIGVTGLNAAQLGLLTTEHNITNANTPGYNRQRIVQTTNEPLLTGAGALGQGVHVSTVERMYNRFLSNQVNTSQTNVSQLDTYYQEVSQIDNMMADANSGLSPALQEFFTGVQKVAADPSNLTARQSMVSSAQTLTARFQSLETRLTEIADGVNGQITSVVSQANSYAQQIANLNDRIIIAQGSNQQPANDLLDQRDQLVSSLNKLIKVTTTTNTDGSYNVFIGTGQQLVVGSQSMSMVAMASTNDKQRTVVGLKSSGGATQEMPESLITGGQLGGLISFRNESLDKSFNELGRVAASLALTFNAQNAVGEDLVGNTSTSASFVKDFFTLSPPRVVAASTNAAGGPSVSISLNQTSTGQNYTNLTGSDYQLAYQGGTLTLTRMSDNTKWTGASIAALNAQIGAGGTNPQGFDLSATAGAFTNNDSFVIQPTREAARNIGVDSRVVADTRLVAAAVPVRAGAIPATNTGNGKLSGIATSTNYNLTGLGGVSVVHNGGNLSGFPAGVVTVTVGGVSTDYPIAGPATTIPYTSGATVTINDPTKTASTPAGVSFVLTGTLGANDTFSLVSNTGSVGVSDGGNALLLGKLLTKSTMSGGTANYQTVYAQMVGDIGNKTQEISVTKDAQTALLDQATASREALSGVNLDEEAANLIRYQQAYQAASKMLDIGAKLFDSILSIRS